MQEGRKEERKEGRREGGRRKEDPTSEIT